MKKHIIFLCKFLAFVTSCCIFTDILAQNKIEKNKFFDTFSFQTAFYQGKIWQHTPNFKPDVTENTQMYEFALTQDTKGRELWQQLHKYPTLSASFLYADFGDKAVFGSAYALFPALSFSTRKKHLNFHYRIGAGLAYVTKTYDALDNAINNVIGSHFNNITSIMLALEWKIRPQVRLFTTASFTHFSNGKVQMPNLGINVPAYGLALKYYPKKTSVATVADFEKTVESKRSFLDKKNRLTLKLGHGFNEALQSNGAKYSVFVGEIYASRRMNLKWRILLGAEANYYMVLHHYIFNEVAFQEKEEWKALKIAAFTGAEVFFGHFSTIFTSGYYVYNPFQKRGPIPTKIGLQYHVFSPYMQNNQLLFIGVYLKAHISNADYIELGLGYTF